MNQKPRGGFFKACLANPDTAASRCFLVLHCCEVTAVLNVYLYIIVYFFSCILLEILLQGCHSFLAVNGSIHVGVLETWCKVRWNSKRHTNLCQPWKCTWVWFFLRTCIRQLLGTGFEQMFGFGWLCVCVLYKCAGLRIGPGCERQYVATSVASLRVLCSLHLGFLFLYLLRSWGSSLGPYTCWDKLCSTV